MENDSNIESSLVPRLREALNALQITSLTPIQQLTLKTLRDNPKKNVILHSPTGTGKTLAYLLPLLNQISSKSRSSELSRSMGTILLILAPARELALQIYTVVQNILRYSPFLVPGILVGGENRAREKARLRKGISALVATPGRLLDHIYTTHSFRLSELEYVVLDEADRVLDSGFEKDLRTLSELFKERCMKLSRIMFITATMHPRLAEVAQHILDADPLLIRLPIHNEIYESILDHSIQDPQSNADNTTSLAISQVTSLNENFQVPSSILQYYVICAHKNRLVTLLSMLSWILSDSKRNFSNALKVIVFVHSSKVAEFLYMLTSRLPNPFGAQIEDDGTILRVNKKRRSKSCSDQMDEETTWIDQNVSLNSGKQKPLFLSSATMFRLHSAMNQEERASTIETFRKNLRCVLFCTDVAARGLDVENVDWVVQYDPPIDENAYVHRVGRTGRLGREGTSFLFAAPNELGLVDYLATEFGIQIKKRSTAVMLYHLLRSQTTAEAARAQKETDLWEQAHRLQLATYDLIGGDEDLKDLAMNAFKQWRAGFASGYTKKFCTLLQVHEINLKFALRAFALHSIPNDYTSRKVGIHNPTSNGTNESWKPSSMNNKRFKGTHQGGAQLDHAHRVPSHHARDLIRDEFSFG